MSGLKPVLCLLILGLFSAPVAADEDIFKIGVEALNKKDYRFAIACFNDVLLKDPKNFEAYYYRGLAQSGKEFWESAVNNFTETIRLNPRHARAYVARGNAYIELKDYENAVQDHHQALQLDGKFALANMNRGKSYAEIKNYRAVEDFSAAVRLSPYNHMPYLDRGNAYLDGERFDKAIQDFSEAIRWSGLDPTPYLRRGQAYAKKEDWKKAIEDYSAAIGLGSDAYLARSAAYAAIGERGKSFEDWMKAMEGTFPFLRKKDQQKKRDNYPLLRPIPLPPLPADDTGDFPFYDELPPPK